MRVSTLFAEISFICLRLWIPGNAVGRVAGTAWVHLLGRSGQQFGAVGVITCQQLGAIGWSVGCWVGYLIQQHYGVYPARNRVSPPKIYKPNPLQYRAECLTLHNTVRLRQTDPPLLNPVTCTVILPSKKYLLK